MLILVAKSRPCEYCFKVTKIAIFKKEKYSRRVQKLPQVIIFVQALRICLSAHLFTICSLLIKPTKPERADRTAFENLRTYVYYVIKFLQHSE